MIYIVPTPIGNLDDITIRGIKVLSKAKIILCEDGKITSKLLKLLKIENRPKYINLVRNNKFNESSIRLGLNEVYGNKNLENEPRQLCHLERSERSCGVKFKTSVDLDTNLYNSIQIQNSTDLETDDQVIAIVTDAGTPGISDPAFEIIQILQELKLDYTVLPGATAVIPAIVSSNLVSKEFIFLGFLPLKKGRQTVWNEIKIAKYPIVIYESCHRIVKLIQEIQINLSSQSQISISQEISKKHENTWIGKVIDLKNYQVKGKGEFVVVIRNSA